MTEPEIRQTHAELLTRGWSVTVASEIGMPPEEWVVEAFTSHLRPQVTGKTHARDVISFTAGDLGTWELSEADSIEITPGIGRDDPRVHVMAENLNVMVSAFLNLIPRELSSAAGKVALTYFRYNDQADVGPHQDQFGDVIAIWTLHRTPGGGASFLRSGDNIEQFRAELPAGSVLIFRDERFWHGFTPLAPSGTRDALVFIRLRSGY